MTDPNASEGDFAVTLLALTLDLDDLFDEDDAASYRASFGIERDERRFVASVWFPKDASPTVDLVRFAMSRLHLVLAQLARQTEGWRIDERLKG